MGGNEQEIKAEMAVRQQQDSLTITAGTPGKSQSVSLKCYFNISDLDDTPDNKVQKKVENLLKVRAYLKEQGLIE